MIPIKAHAGDTGCNAVMFQSLFFWMIPIKSFYRPCCCFCSNVSILVLLDDPHQDYSIDVWPSGDAMFQSLFFWMIPIKSSAGHRRGWPSGFQSLFFWMIPIKPTDGGGIQILFLVSILVLLDDPHQGLVLAGNQPKHDVSILVLLDDPHQAA